MQTSCMCFHLECDFLLDDIFVVPLVLICLYYVKHYKCNNLETVSKEGLLAATKKAIMRKYLKLETPDH